MKTTTYKNESGFTLLELLLVIGVAALLLIGGIATYRLVSDGNKATEASRLLLTLRQEAQTMAQQQGGNYAGITFASTDTTTPSTSPFVIGGILRSQQRNPFNGNITIAPVAPANQQVTIVFENVSQASCVKLMQAINAPNDLISVGTATRTFSSATAGDIPVTAANAAAACNQSVNTITWTLP